MTLLSWIMHQVAKIIIYGNLFLNSNIYSSKANSVVFSMAPLSRIIQQFAKKILHRDFFYIHIFRVIKTTHNAFQWPRCSGLYARSLRQHSTGTFFIFIYIATNTKFITISLIPLFLFMLQVSKLIIYENLSKTFIYIYS